MLKLEHKGERVCFVYSLEGKDVLAVLPTGFGKSLIKLHVYQSLVFTKGMDEHPVGCFFL